LRFLFAACDFGCCIGWAYWILVLQLALSTQVLVLAPALVLGGVAQLLTPTPKINQPGTPQDNNDPRKSYSFSGIQNTSRQGTPVPIVYGETLVGSVVISAGIDTVQVYG
jgi:predicted phage tail protein